MGARLCRAQRVGRVHSPRGATRGAATRTHLSCSPACLYPALGRHPVGPPVDDGYRAADLVQPAKQRARSPAATWQAAPPQVRFLARTCPPRTAWARLPALGCGAGQTRRTLRRKARAREAARSGPRSSAILTAASQDVVDVVPEPVRLVLRQARRLEPAEILTSLRVQNRRRRPSFLTGAWCTDAPASLPRAPGTARWNRASSLQDSGLVSGRPIEGFERALHPPAFQRHLIVLNSMLVAVDRTKRDSQPSCLSTMPAEPRQVWMPAEGALYAAIGASPAGPMSTRCLTCSGYWRAYVAAR